MQRINIPNDGDAVQVFVQLLGDEEYSGPYHAIVRGVDITSRPLPIVIVLVEPFGCLLRVPYGAGTPAYWLPTDHEPGVRS